MGKGGLIGAAVLSGLLLAACSSTPAPVVDAPVILDQAEANQPVGTRMPDNDADLCKAADFQYLVGRPRTEIPVPVEVVSRRVVCTTCPVTMDFSPYRLNFFYNEVSGIVERVRCG